MLYIQKKNMLQKYVLSMNTIGSGNGASVPIGTPFVENG
jgi:hypothetical protein